MGNWHDHKNAAFKKYRATDGYKVGGFRHSKRVLCIETNEEFNSIADCAKKMNLSKAAISQFLLGREKTKHVKGYTFKELGTITL